MLDVHDVGQEPILGINIFQEMSDSVRLDHLVSHLQPPTLLQDHLCCDQLASASRDAVCCIAGNKKRHKGNSAAGGNGGNGGSNNGNNANGGNNNSSNNSGNGGNASGNNGNGGKGGNAKGGESLHQTSRVSTSGTGIAKRT